MNISPENKQEAKYPRMLTAAVVTAAAAAVASCQQQREPQGEIESVGSSLSPIFPTSQQQQAPQGLMGVRMSEIFQYQTRWENRFYHRPESEDNTKKAPDVQSDR